MISTFLLLIMGIFSLFPSSVYANTSQSSTSSALTFQYPTPTAASWKQFKSHIDMVQSCQIPDNVLHAMSTDQLIEATLNYPLFMDIYAYDTTQDGFNAVAQQFNGIKELLQRQDAGSKLLDVYKKMKVTTDKQKNSDNLFRLAYIEVLLGQNDIINKLSTAESQGLNNAVQEKYTEKKAQSDIYGTTVSTFYDVQAKVNRSSAIVPNTTSSYVYTPRGTAVPVQVLGELLS